MHKHMRLQLNFKTYVSKVKDSISKIKTLILRHRVCCLFASVVFGALLFYCLCNNNCIHKLVESLNIEKRTRDSLFILLSSSFAMFLLWYYRNHDRREQINIGNKQIEKSNEQIEKSNEQIEASTLNNILMMLSEDKNIKKVANGLKLGIFLKNETKNEAFKNQIDMATRGAYLEEADLQEAILKGAKLQRAILRKANLQWTKLQGADLREANLQVANLYWAKLQGAILREANLQWAYLQCANLQCANLQWVNLQGAILQMAILKEADLQEADLQGAQLEGADLQVADLQCADLKGANLQGANLYKAQLQRAKLQCADLKRVNLQEADLQVAKLQVADLRGADLQGAKLQRANLQGAKYNRHTTTFPEGFDPEAHGMVRIEELDN